MGSKSLNMEYKGMSELQLLEFCSDQKIVTSKMGYHNWTSEIYGIGKHLREYAYYPMSFPLLVHSDHGGPYQHDTALPIDIDTESPVLLFHSPRYLDEFKKQSAKTAYVLYSPFVFYRKKKRIKQSDTANGTLAFVAHSTPLIDDQSEIVDYINDLRHLPEEFQPVSAMIHYHDVNKGLHKVFLENGMPVYTAGNPHDYRFTERFYSIIRNFRYTTSNHPMSCLFYSIEMGIPHFLYGNKPVFVNKGDENVTAGDYDAEKENLQVRKLVALFSGIQSIISERQRQFVEYELGLHHGLGRLRCAFVLYRAWVVKLLLLSSEKAKFSVKRMLSIIKKSIG